MASAISMVRAMVMVSPSPAEHADDVAASLILI
jgi:hypothetical protein